MDPSSPLIRRSHPPGFTLVEILMVLAIMGIMTIVAMPSLVKSIRGNRLRVGARTIVMAANYARTSAILRNQEMKLILDKENNQVSVEPLRAALPALPSDSAFEAAGGGSPPPPLMPMDDSGDTNEPHASPAAFSSITRKLDAVRIDSVTVDQKKSAAKDDSATVVYQSNGRCNPFEVRIIDDYESVMIITVDAVASAKIRKEGE
ncbi:MAG: prepilin-type N-terminal cleavage/methylation domain-containing protein [bacterium]